MFYFKLLIFLGAFLISDIKSDPWPWAEAEAEAEADPDTKRLPTPMPTELMDERKDRLKYFSDKIIDILTTAANKLPESIPPTAPLANEELISVTGLLYKLNIKLKDVTVEGLSNVTILSTDLPKEAILLYGRYGGPVIIKGSYEIDGNVMGTPFEMSIGEFSISVHSLGVEVTSGYDIRVFDKQLAMENTDYKIIGYSKLMAEFNKQETLPEIIRVALSELGRFVFDMIEDRYHEEVAEFIKTTMNKYTKI